MLLKRGIAVTILIVSGRRTRGARLPGTLSRWPRPIPFAADRCGFPCKVNISNQSQRSADVPGSPASRAPAESVSAEAAPPERRPDVVTRAHPESSSADASTPSGLAPEEQEPVTWLQHPPIKIIT